MLRSSVLLVHTHMLDATHPVQINMPVFLFSNMLDATAVMGWGGVGMLTFLEFAHMLDATQLCYSRAHTHTHA